MLFVFVKNKINKCNYTKCLRYDIYEIFYFILFIFLISKICLSEFKDAMLFKKNKRWKKTILYLNNVRDKSH